MRAHAALLFVPALALFDVVAVLAIDPAAAPVMTAFNGAAGGAALVALTALRGPARRYPTVVLTLVATAVTLISVLVGFTVPSLAGLAVSYLVVLPAAVALLASWSPFDHVRWLCLYAITALPAIVTLPTAANSERLGIALAALAAVVISVAGSMIAFDAERRAFELREELVAERAELARINRTLASSLRHDELTGAGNRVRLDEELAAARVRLAAGGPGCALLAIDLDRFKAVNDSRGHLWGDAVLRLAVDTIAACVGPRGAIFRTGGDEFALLVHDLHPWELAFEAERIRAAVESLAVPHPDNAPHGVVTVSLGATTVRAGDLEYTDDDWFGWADLALYRAKTAGRNRVELAAEPVVIGFEPEEAAS